jgi:hypothetical protein
MALSAAALHFGDQLSLTDLVLPSRAGAGGGKAAHRAALL